MSGDVQPRKRKDKKRKKDDVDDVINQRTVPTVTTTQGSPSGVHASKMVGPDDVQIHVHKDAHGTGGHWCAKVVFFSLLAILVGVIGLIILENRGHTDVDTPVAESRFSEYFEGWVEEVKDGGHDEHDVLESLHEIDDHNKDDEPFVEEDDHDDGNDDHDDEQDDHNNDNDDEEEQNSTENDSNEEEDEIENEVNLNDEDEEKNILEENDVEDDNDDDKEADDDVEDVKEGIKEEVVRYTRSVGVDAQPIQEIEDSDEVNDQDANSEENKVDNKEDSDERNNQEENVKSNDDENDDTDNDDIDDNTPFEEHEQKTEKNNTIIITGDLLEKQVDDLIENYNKLADSLNRPRFIENKKNIVSINNKKTVHNDGEMINDAKMEDDDSFEEVIDNDDGEELHLQRLAEESKEAEKNNENAENKPESSSIAVKIVVGVALFIVAHLVLVKKPETKDDRNIKDVKPVDEQIVTEKEVLSVRAEPPVNLPRKLTLITANETIPIEPGDEIVYDDDDELYDDNDLDEELYENRVEDDEEIIEYSDDENFINENTQPQTFEDMNAMFKVPNVPDSTNKQQAPQQQPDIIKDKSPARYVFIEPKISQPVNKISKTFVEPLKSQQIPAATSEIPPALPKKQEKIDSVPSKLQFGEVKPFEVKSKNDEEDEELLLDEDEDEDNDEGDVIEIDEDEEDISDVDDSDLMKRLEAKYGKLPVQLDISDEEADQEELDEDEEDVDDEEFNSKWTKLPASRGAQAVNDDQMYEDLSRANNMLHEYPKDSIKLFEKILQTKPKLPGALYGKARALDRLSDVEKTNIILLKAIDAYIHVLDLDSQITDEIFKAVAERCIDRIRFIGQHARAVDVHEKLIKRFNNEPKYRNQLALTFLLSNRLSEAKKVLHETLLRWRTDGFALVHYGFVLKNLDQDMVNAVKYLREGISSGAPGTNDGRFYFNLGDALVRLGHNDEAHEVYRDGANKKLFLSEYQRSLYNVERLTARPFWTKEQTTYEQFFNVLEQNWLQIRDEGLNLLNNDGNFKDVIENLRDVGDWKQFELYARGQKIVNNCHKVMLTCKIIEMFPHAKACSRGQVKFSVMQPGTHVWSHCGPTNCRLRAHLGLQVPSNTFLRVATETRSWENGKILIFDDSFEHEVWHNGTTTRLVLIIDVWHPDLTDEERKTLTRI